jgi:hypothetical protein
VAPCGECGTSQQNVVTRGNILDLGENVVCRGTVLYPWSTMKYFGSHVCPGTMWCLEAKCRTLGRNVLPWAQCGTSGYSLVALGTMCCLGPQCVTVGHRLVPWGTMWQNWAQLIGLGHTEVPWGTSWYLRAQGGTSGANVVPRG